MAAGADWGWLRVALTLLLLGQLGLGLGLAAALRRPEPIGFAVPAGFPVADSWGHVPGLGHQHLPLAGMAGAQNLDASASCGRLHAFLQDQCYLHAAHGLSCPFNAAQLAALGRGPDCSISHPAVLAALQGLDAEMRQVGLPALPRLQAAPPRPMSPPRTPHPGGSR